MVRLYTPRFGYTATDPIPQFGGSAPIAGGVTGPAIDPIVRLTEPTAPSPSFSPFGDISYTYSPVSISNPLITSGGSPVPLSFSPAPSLSWCS